MYTFLLFKCQDEIQFSRSNWKQEVNGFSLSFLWWNFFKFSLQKDFHATILYLAKLSIICKDKTEDSCKQALSLLLCHSNTCEEVISHLTPTEEISVSKVEEQRIKRKNNNEQGNFQHDIMS